MTPHDRALELLALAIEDLYVARVLSPDSKAFDSMIDFYCCRLFPADHSGLRSP